MLTFELQAKEKIAIEKLKKLKYSDSELLDDLRDMKIFVNNRLFFRDESFTPLEFCQYACNWLLENNYGCLKSAKKRVKCFGKKRNSADNTDFVFNTIESYETPFLAFEREKGGYVLRSVYQLFESTELFQLDDVVDFLESVIAFVVSF